MNRLLRTRWLIVAAAWAATMIALLPVLLHWKAPAPSRAATLVAGLLGLAAAYLLCRLFYRLEVRRLSKSHALSLVWLVFLLTAFCEYTHHFFVDPGFFSPGFPNSVWQARLQEMVVRLDPAVLPHSYRFLPNAIVFWMQIVGVKFSYASEIFRSLTMLLLFYALYRFGRLFTTHLGALIAMLLVGAVYPVSFVGYSGQLTDPLSHLSFLLSFIFLEMDEFILFLSALLIGSLAKETVLGMLGFYVLFAWSRRHYRWKAPVLVGACLAAYFGVRSYVLHGAMQYQQVSGVHLEFILTNLRVINWPFHFMLTGIAFLPFLILGWKDTPLILKRLTFYLWPLLLLSSMFFSWLNEARNYMPMVFVLAVVTGRYLVAQADPSELIRKTAEAP